MWMISSGSTVGGLLGFVMQRTRFCLTGDFRDTYVQGDNKMFYVLLTAITIQSIGLSILTITDILQTPAHSSSILGTIIGSFIFGIGIVLVGGYATGTWYRADEGLIGSWIALVLYVVTAVITKAGTLKSVMDKINQPMNVNSDMPRTTGILFWELVAVLTIVTIFLVVKTFNNKKIRIAVPKLRQRYTGIRYYLFGKQYHPFIAAIVTGLIALLAWSMSASTGRNDGLGIITPSANLVHFSTTGETKFIDWGVFLALGVFIGSYTAARGSKGFKWRLPDKIITRNSAIGGICMGFSVSVVGGCFIGDGLVETATMTWQGWIALVPMTVGVWTMSHFIFVCPMKKVYQQSAKVKQQTQIV